jgi:hypothetical protein
VKLASLRHWGKTGEMEWQMRLGRHQRVYGGKDLESEACGLVLKSPRDPWAKEEGKDGYVRDQSANVSLNENESHGPSRKMCDLKSANVRSGCVHASLHGMAKTADGYCAWRPRGHANGRRPSDCHVRGHGHHECASARGEHPHYVIDADVHARDYESDRDDDGRP